MRHTVLRAPLILLHTMIAQSPLKLPQFAYVHIVVRLNVNRGKSCGFSTTLPKALTFLEHNPAKEIWMPALLVSSHLTTASCGEGADTIAMEKSRAMKPS